MLLDTILGCAIFLITRICLLYTSHLLVRRFFSDAPPAVRLVSYGVLYYVFIILIFQLLSPFYAITKTWVTATCLLLALIAYFIWGDQRNIKVDIEPIRTWIRDGYNSRWAALIIFCGFVVILSFLRALLMPPLVYDCLTYHLTFAAMWIKKGTLFLFKAPDQIIDCAYFPINGELFASWILLPFHTDLLVNLMNFPITLLGGISCYAIGRELGLTRKEASFAPALICFAPMIYSQITTALVDNSSFAFYTASVLFILRYLRKAHLYEGLMSLATGGILLGIKHSGLPVVGLIFIAFSARLVTTVSPRSFLKKCSLILSGLLIICALGGRQYILNTIEANNPLYPFSVEVLQEELLKGSDKWEQVREWITQYEKEHGWDKFSLWERGYRRSLYLDITTGPKFLTFLLLALISLFSKPSHVSRSVWYFLSILWIVPFALFYTDTSVNCARKGPWIESSSRFLSPYIALFTIQGLVLIKKLSSYFKVIDYLFVALITWDLLYINKSQLKEVEVLYPLMILIVFLLLISYRLVREKLKRVEAKKIAIKPTTKTPGLGATKYTKWIIYITGFISLILGLYCLQCYRDSTRYQYFRSHSDHQSFIPLSIKLVDAWEYLDHPGEKKKIALAMDAATPLGTWLFYPLLGKWLQNEIVYISAKHKWEVPSWLDRGLLRGNDLSTWLFNLREEKVDYIFVMKPWPIELQWINSRRDKFQLVFSNNYCKIFKYTGVTD